MIKITKPPMSNIRETLAYQNQKSKALTCISNRSPLYERDALLFCNAGWFTINQLKETKDMLDIFFTHYKEVGAMVDTSFRLLVWNKSATSFVNKRSSDLKKYDSFVDQCSWDIRAFFEECFSRALKGETFYAEIARASPDGGVNYWNILFTPAKDETGHIFGVIFVGEDTTEFKTFQSGAGCQFTLIKQIAIRQSRLMTNSSTHVHALLPMMVDDPTDEGFLKYMEIEHRKLKAEIILAVYRATTTAN